MFTSARLENVEGVAHLLREAGIEIKLTEGRSYRKVSRREFSYRDNKRDGSAQPAVWVVNSEDYKRARELLHSAGLLQTEAKVSYVPDALQETAAEPLTTEKRLTRIRMVLLAVLGAMVCLSLLRVFLTG
jgi:hypothetical protein